MDNKKNVVSFNKGIQIRPIPPINKLIKCNFLAPIFFAIGIIAKAIEKQTML